MESHHAGLVTYLPLNQAHQPRRIAIVIGQTLVTCAALELEAEPTQLNSCTQEKGQRRPTTLTLTSLYEAVRNVAVDSGRHFPLSAALRFNCSEAPPGCSSPCSLSSHPPTRPGGSQGVPDCRTAMPRDGGSRPTPTKLLMQGRTHHEGRGEARSPDAGFLSLPFPPRGHLPCSLPHSPVSSSSC